MTFGRWLLVHSLSISILVMLGVGFFFKDELKLNEAYSQLLQLDESTIKNLRDGGVQETKPPIEALEMVEESATQVELSSPPLSEPVVKEETVAEKQQEKSFEPEVKSESSVISSVINEPVDYLLKAREAYWDNEFQYAIELYSAEIKKNPSSPDLYGEIGNIYYGLDNYSAASDYYLKAGELFLQANDDIRAKQIYEILVTISPEKAQQLLDVRQRVQN